MSAKTGIEWTESTWNPVTGCSKVSAGCKHCYAERDWRRLSANTKTRYFGREFTDVQCHQDVLQLPLRWTKPRRIFVNSMSDLFHDAVPDEFIDQVFAVMALCPQHTFQILTKRPARLRTYIETIPARASRCRADLVVRLNDPDSVLGALRSDYEGAKPWPLANVWLGVSIEDQPAADERIPLLLQTPAAVRWISAEPLLGAIDIRRYLDVDLDRGLGEPWLDWVAAGGESGPHARPSHPDWFRSLRDQCQAADVPFLFKQWGEWEPREKWDAPVWKMVAIMPDGSDVDHDTAPQDVGGHRMARVGKKNAGRLLDGIQHDGYPMVQS